MKPTQTACCPTKKWFAYHEPKLDQYFLDWWNRLFAMTIFCKNCVSNKYVLFL